MLSDMDLVNTRFSEYKKNIQDLVKLLAGHESLFQDLKTLTREDVILL